MGHRYLIVTIIISRFYTAPIILLLLLLLLSSLFVQHCCELLQRMDENRYAENHCGAYYYVGGCLLDKKNDFLANAYTPIILFIV